MPFLYENFKSPLRNARLEGAKVPVHGDWSPYFSYNGIGVYTKTVVLSLLLGQPTATKPYPSGCRSPCSLAHMEGPECCGFLTQPFFDLRYNMQT